MMSLDTISLGLIPVLVGSILNLHTVMFLSNLKAPSVHAHYVPFIVFALEEVLINHGHGSELPLSRPGLAVGNITVE